MRPIILAGALALGVAGASAALAQSTMSHSGMTPAGLDNSAPGDPAAALPTGDYITKAGQSAQFQIQEGQMAASMAKAPAVKNFGLMMVTEHRKTTEQLTRTIAGEGVSPPPPPPPLTADQQAQIDQLRSVTGAEFDRVYLSQQLAAHEEALKVQADYSKGGSDPKLRQVAAATVPIVQGHLNTLRTLQARSRGAS